MGLFAFFSVGTTGEKEEEFEEKRNTGKQQQVPFKAEFKVINNTNTKLITYVGGGKYV